MEKFICENCGKEHDGSYGSGRFCSIRCRTLFCNNLKSPKAKEGGWKCPHCGEVFRTRKEKQMHGKEAHPEMSKARRVE